MIVCTGAVELRQVDVNQIDVEIRKIFGSILRQMIFSQGNDGPSSLF